jgi:hypothetical protein
VLEKLGDALRAEPGFLIVRASGGEETELTHSKRQRSRR